MGSVAIAADMMQPPPPEAVMTSGWDGAYIGGGVIFESSTTIAETIVGGQGVLGFNHTMDSFLIGGEAYVMPYWSSLSGLGASIGAEGRAGFLATESVLLYGALGAEITNTANTYGTIGGGVEFKATDNLSLDLEYKYYVGLNNAWRGNHIGISANWHF
jgi:opacity protein-like surface antigen